MIPGEEKYVLDGQHQLMDHQLSLPFLQSIHWELEVYHFVTFHQPKY